MPTTPFEYFVGRQNQRMVQLLESNREISEFFYNVLDHLVEHANAKGKRFADLKIDMPHVTSDGYLKARIL